jgi:hypothetical protein
MISFMVVVMGERGRADELCRERLASLRAKI